MRLVRLSRSVVIAGLLLAALAHAQSAPAPASAPTPPPSPVSGIRNKISAGDLLSAESILEVHREKNGEDAAWLTGLSWLARGAFLLGDLPKAQQYSDGVRARAAQQRASGVKLANDHDLEYALGSALEVEAQRLERVRGRNEAIAFVRAQLADTAGSSLGFRSRLMKRWNLLTLEGTPAPEIDGIEAGLAAAGGAGPLAARRGRPVVLFGWAEGCGDCKAQAASLARVMQRRRADGVELVALTRWYGEPGEHALEQARADSVWAAVYAGLEGTPRPVSPAAMLRYGVSSTPTFVFVDRKGIVRRYTPTRLTEAELDREIAALLR